MERAKLIYRYGAMNSGKTAHILMTAHNYEEQGMKVLLYKAALDTKGSDHIVSRFGGEKRKVDCLIQPEDSLLKLSQMTEDVACILVDEAQFLSPKQVEELLQITIQLKIPVIAYGLRTDAFLNGWPGAIRLLSLADSIEEMKTICKCGRKATFVIRKKNGIPVFDGDQVAIDGEQGITYESVCKVCYFKQKEELELNMEGTPKKLVKKIGSNRS